MSGQRVTGQGFEDEARRALSAVDKPQGKLEDTMDDMLKDVNAWMEHFERKGFLGMEWLQNVPINNVGEEEADQKVVGSYSKLGMRSFKGVEDVEEGKVTLLPGLGTMVRFTDPLFGMYIDQDARCRTRWTSSVNPNGPIILSGRAK